MELTSLAKHGEVMREERVQFCSWMGFPEQFCSLRFLESQGEAVPAEWLLIFAVYGEVESAAGASPQL